MPQTCPGNISGTGRRHSSTAVFIKYLIYLIYTPSRLHSSPLLAYWRGSGQRTKGDSQNRSCSSAGVDISGCLLQAACSHAGCRPLDNKTLAVRLATDAARLKRGLHSQRCPHQSRVQDPLARRSVSLVCELPICVCWRGSGSRR